MIRRLKADHRGASRGMTLVEVLVALVLLVFGLLGVVGMVINQVEGLVRTERQAQASALAAGYLAELQLAGYDWLDARLEEAGDAGEVALRSEPQISGLDPHFMWVAHAQRDPISENIHRIRIDVAVGWRNTLDDPASSIPQAQSRKATGYVVAP